MDKEEKKAMFARLLAEQAEIQKELNKDREWVEKRCPVGKEEL